MCLKSYSPEDKIAMHTRIKNAKEDSHNRFEIDPNFAKKCFEWGSQDIRRNLLIFFSLLPLLSTIWKYVSLNYILINCTNSLTSEEILLSDCVACNNDSFTVPVNQLNAFQQVTLKVVVTSVCSFMLGFYLARSSRYCLNLLPAHVFVKRILSGFEIFCVIYIIIWIGMINYAEHHYANTSNTTLSCSLQNQSVEVNAIF
jgi:hypothetical protein